MAKERLPIIRASEMGEYTYCAHAWWLRRVAGLEPGGRARREYGTLLHKRHRRALIGSRMVLLGGMLLAVIALILMLMSR